jgi:hypothetical protein
MPIRAGQDGTSSKLMLSNLGDNCPVQRSYLAPTNRKFVVLAGPPGRGLLYYGCFSSLEPPWR